MELENIDTHISNQVYDPLHTKYSGNKGKILEMLGSGMGPEIVSSTVGVTPGYISQLLADKEFAEAVTARRFELLSKHNARDAKIDELEDAAIKKLATMLELVYKPMEVARIFQVVNAAKRRGSGATQEASTIINNQVVNLVLPPAITQRFTRDSNNQVIEVESSQVQEIPKPQRQSLVTMPSNALQGLLDKRRNPATAALAFEEGNKNVFIDPTAGAGEATAAE